MQSLSWQLWAWGDSLRGGEYGITLPSRKLSSLLHQSPAGLDQRPRQLFGLPNDQVTGPPEDVGEVGPRLLGIDCDAVRMSPRRTRVEHGAAGIGDAVVQEVAIPIIGLPIGDHQQQPVW